MHLMMRHLLSHKFSNGIHRCEIQFTIVHIMITRFGDNLLPSDFASFIITASHMNVGAATSQIENSFTPNARVAAGHNNDFPVDAYVAGELAALDPFSV